MNISRKIITVLASVALAASVLVGPALADTDPRTQTIWMSSGTGGADVIPYLNGNKQLMFVDFSSKDFGNIDYVYFNLTYNADSLGNVGVKRGLEGSFAPYYETKNSFGGVAYIRKQLLFGTCSSNVCTYDPNVRNIKLTVNTKMHSGQVAQYTKVLTVPTSLDSK